MTSIAAVCRYAALGCAWGVLVGCHRTGSAASGTSPAPVAQEPPARNVVTADDIQREPHEPVERSLLGRIPGVTVIESPDGGIIIRVRGVTSIHGNAAPLYVIDGIPVQPGPNGGLYGIAPNDIESIEVLKGPVGTSMYGARGANGVIVITTKRPDQ